MLSELDLLLDVTRRLEDAGLDYMLSDAENLLGTGADIEYLQTWSRKLNLTAMLTRVSP
jgi:hypothetical protein